MTSEQQTQIREYLLSRNLPIDLLMEVQDHFMTQIAELQKQELTFEQAFKKTKDSWLPDLRFSSYNVRFDLNDVSKFEKKVRNRQQITMLKKSLVLSMVTCAVLYLSAYFISEAAFGYFFIAVLGSLMIVPLMVYFYNIKLFRLIKQYDNYKLTTLQNTTQISAITAGSSAVILYNGLQYIAYFHPIMTGSISLRFVIVVILVFMFAAIHFYCLLSQFFYLQQIKRIQPFLQFLKSSM